MSSKEIMVSGKPLSSLRVVDLKEELEKRGLSKSGSKKDLAERLRMNILLENQRTAQSSADEEQLPNLSTREQLAEQNPFIRDYFASQAELYHSQKVVKKLYEGMAQTPEGEQRQQQTQEEQQQESTEESEDSKGPTQVEPERIEKQAEVIPAVIKTEESSTVSQPVKEEAGQIKEETSKEDQVPSEASNGNSETADVKEAAVIKEEQVLSSPSEKEEKEQGQEKPVEEKQVKEQEVQKKQVEEKKVEEKPVDEKEVEEKPVEEMEVMEKQEEEKKVQEKQVEEEVEKKQTEEKQAEERKQVEEREAVERQTEKKQVDEMEVDEKQEEEQAEERKQVEEREAVERQTEKKQVDEMEVDEKQKEEPALEAEDKAPAVQGKSPVRNSEAVIDVPKKPTPEAVESITSESKTVHRNEESTSEEPKLSSPTEGSVSPSPKGEEQDQDREVKNSAGSTPEERTSSETSVSKSAEEKVEENVVEEEEEEDEDEEEDAEDKKDERTWKRRPHHKSPQLESSDQQAAIGTIIKTEETKEKSVISVTRSSSPGSENIMAVEKSAPRVTTVRSEQMDVDEALDYGEEEAESKREHGQSTWSRRILRLKNRCAVIEKSDKKWTRVDRKPVVVTSKVLESFFPDVKPLPESEVKLEERIPKEPVADDAEKISKEASEHAAEEKPAEATLSNVKRKISIIPFEETTKELTPPRNTPTDILVITNLTRPFTLMQLRELLQRTGTIQEIWVDKIKSRCLAKFEKQSEAEETRAALHGIQWPPSNPKSLCVDFTTSSEFEDVTAKDSGDKKVKNEKPTEANSLPVREWDLGKRSRSRSPGRIKRGRSGSPDRKRSRKSASPPRARRSPHHDKKTRDHDSSKEEPQIKALDELFRKTTATPCLYWLPLTPEQIAEKEELRRKRMIERERRLAEMEKLRPR